MYENRETSPSAPESRGPVGKGDSHKAGMNGGEESDRAIVPMNSLNKAMEQRTRAAEGEEGRARAKENAGEPNTSPTPSGERVSRGLIGVREAASSL